MAKEDEGESAVKKYETVLTNINIKRKGKKM